MILSNDGLVAFHYRSYGTFFLQQNWLHNIYRGFTHYKYYRAFILGLFALLFIRSIFYLLKGLWFVLEFCFMILVVKMILGTVRWMTSWIG